jgi:CW-type Zinc Finger
MEEKIYARSVNKDGVSLRVIDGKSINRCFSSQEVAAMQQSLNWVQCDNCEKWRVLPKSKIDLEALKFWTCDMNDSDPLNQSCEKPERTQKWYEKHYPIDEVSSVPGSPLK